MKILNSPLILASASQRRIEILGMLDIPFISIPADIDESDKPDETPADYVLRLSIEKARKISQDRPEAFVIGSDITIELNGKAIQKAETSDQAYSMLASLAGVSHQTRCGYAVIFKNELLASGVVSTLVEFEDVKQADLKAYVDSEEWMDRAGAYGIQGTAAEFVKSFQGSYFDILGLPIYEIGFTLMKFGFPIKMEFIKEIIKKDMQKVAFLNSNKKRV